MTKQPKKDWHLPVKRSFSRLSFLQKRKSSFSLIIAFLLVSLSSFGQLYPESEAGNLAGQAVNLSVSSEPGLLFYLSGEDDFTADFAAGGQDKPNFLHDVKVITDGAVGKAFQSEDDQLLTYWAPGNIFSQRGTLSFFWRSRYPVGPTPFPVFRVAFADNTSWDMAWLRIDYNGSGFDAFVTDVGMARTRVSYYMDQFPAPDKWIHIALSWDETVGIRLYIDGKQVAQQSTVGKVYDTGLDQFGPHSRIISPYQVQSHYSFIRGGDFDELRIYDRMLSDENIAVLAQGEAPEKIPSNKRDLNERRWRDEWWTQNGWNLPNKAPALLPSENTIVRKVEIHDAYDIKRWFWKANDGIRETTWPGVYNMSRLPGRYDYFVYPDWDCYSRSGQTVKFTLPDEPWNHVEIWGTAWGQLTYEKEHEYDNTFAVRTKDQVKSYHDLKKPEVGGKLRFDNAVIEDPIGELSVYYVHAGSAPKGTLSETFLLQPAPDELKDNALKGLAAFINGRYPADERMMMVGNNVASKSNNPASTKIANDGDWPFIHVLIPYGDHPTDGLDGVEIQLPALSVNSTHHGVYPMNIRVKDPLWPMRDLADFSFSVKPNTPQTLWIDTRDRLLPEGKALYISIAGAGYGLTPEALKGTKVRLIYKTKENAVAENEIDRFTQIRDLWAHTSEERPMSPRLNLYNRFVADQGDLMKANPNSWLGKAYKYTYGRKYKNPPEYKIAECPEGVPEWAFLQGEYMELLDKIFSFYIDNRQISNGEFGGGLSDDDDFTNHFPGIALMGIKPDKIRHSLELLIEGYYDQDRDSYDACLKQRSLPLTTNGLATIDTDLLHAYEEGMQTIGQLMLVDYGNPLYISRAMENAKAILEKVTQIGPDGHRYFRSRLYCGTKMSTEDPWQWSGAYSYNVLHTAYMITQYNGNPELKKMLIELADGLLAHRDEDGNFYTEIDFSTGEVSGKPGLSNAWQVLKAAYDLTGDQKYFEPIKDRVHVSHPFDAKDIVTRYTREIKHLGVLSYIYTEGSIWIDRVYAAYNDLQEDRLGGIALARIHNIYQQNHVSWRIDKPANYKSLAFFLPKADSKSIEVIAYNRENESVGATMTLWGIKPGKWKVVQGLDSNRDQKMDADISVRTIYLERGSDFKLSFTASKQTLLHLELIEPAETDYSERPDLAIGKSGLKISKNEVTVRVYSQGAVGTPETKIDLLNADGQKIQTAKVPAMEAPTDLNARWTEVRLVAPEGTDLSHGSVVVDPEKEINQITAKNTRIDW